MARSQSQPYWTEAAAGNPGTNANQSERLGSPGKYYDPIKWTGGELYLTGSEFGHGAVGRSGSLLNNVTITFFNGTTAVGSEIDAVLVDKQITEVAIKQISASATPAPGSTLYFYKRQQ